MFLAKNVLKREGLIYHSVLDHFEDLVLKDLEFASNSCPGKHSESLLIPLKFNVPSTVVGGRKVGI